MVHSTLAFIGTGAIGAPIAARLLGAGFPLVVTDKRKEATDTLITSGARWADDPAQAAAGADIVFTCLPSRAAIEDVYFGPRSVLSTRKPKCIVDFSTSGPEQAARIGNALTAEGVRFVDAPVTGGIARAKDGTLTIIASGAPIAIEQTRGALEAVGSRLFVVGPNPGQAQTVKLINNMLSYTALAATSEALVLGKKAGIDADIILQVVNTGTGRNSATETKFPTAVLPRTFDYGASHQIAYKDLSLFLGLADDLRVPTPIAGLLLHLWRSWMREHQDEDITTFVKMFEAWSGVEVKGGNTSGCSQ